jgi:segregation and condensation protein B
MASETPDLNTLLKRVEAILFLVRQPIASRRLAIMAELEDGTQARTLVQELNRRYDQQGRSFQVKQVADGYQLRTRPQFARWIRQLDYVPTPTRLTGPALETLTVVAYRQPIIKADIEAIRGVNCGEMLRQLLEKGLIRIAGRSDQLGYPFLYATTKQFLITFGLKSLAALPRSQRLAGPGLPAANFANSPALAEPESRGAEADLPLVNPAPLPQHSDSNIIIDR